MSNDELNCSMVAIPCGASEVEVQDQKEQLQKFIDYLSSNHYAGIMEISGR